MPSTGALSFAVMFDMSEVTVFEKALMWAAKAGFQKLMRSFSQIVIRLPVLWEMDWKENRKK